MEFYRAAKKQDVPVGEGVVSEIQGKSVAIFNLGDRFCAIGNICPHKGASLGEGDVEGTVVTCPWHGWQFDVTTGKNPENSKVSVAKYEVRVEGDDVLIQLDE